VKDDQHLSDEAVAAFADRALGRAAGERARRHTATCAECAAAVAEQREAVWALRAAAPPSMPSSLIDRLRDVPASTPLSGLSGLPAGLDERGHAVFPAFGAAAFAAPVRSAPHRNADPHENAGTHETAGTHEHRAHRMRPLVLTAAAAVAAGAITASAVALGSGESSTSVTPSHVHTARHLIRPANPAPALFGPSR